MYDKLHQFFLEEGTLDCNEEVILNFPLRKFNDKNNKIDYTNNSEIKEKLNRFYKVTERLKEDEWHQEYFLIYNSYVLDST